ncbi:MAG: hypothetical protein KDA96_07745 [Planctomycetaceae bacterium]|nr:hypothetical protein [Planctomycetaceae bacterium]
MSHVRHRPVCLIETANRRLLLSCLMAFAGAMGLPGCKSTDEATHPHPPRIQMREASVLPAGGITRPVVGLVVHARPSSDDLDFGRRLTTALEREMELAPVPVTIHSCTPDELALMVPHLESEVSEIVTVSFQEPALPMPLPGGPVPLEPLPPVLSQFIIVQVTEFRPYYPMKATAKVTILDGVSQQPLFSTTAAWDALRKVPDPMGDVVDLHDYFFRESTPSDPSVIHNSPEFLAQIIAQDIGLWYSRAVAPPPVVIVEE